MDMLCLQADGYDIHCGSLVVVYRWCSCTRETDGCGAKHAEQHPGLGWAEHDDAHGHALDRPKVFSLKYTRACV